MRPMASIALKSLRGAGEWLREYRERQDFSRMSAEQATATIHEAEKMLLRNLTQAIKKYHPRHWVDFAGTKTQPPEWSEGCWYLSRILGQRNFIAGYPYYAIALHIVLKERTEHAVIIAPATRDEFTASRGYGGQFNERRLRVSNRRQLKGGIISCNDLRIASLLETDLENQLAEESSTSVLPDIRVQGCDALDIAYTAAALLDGAIIAHPESLDLDAAMLLAQESGALKSAPAGDVPIVFANAHLQKITSDQIARLTQ